MGLEDAKDFFQRVDYRMPKINVKDKVYQSKIGGFNFKTGSVTYYELTINKIIDIDNGIVLVNGLGYWENPNEYLEREENISNLKLNEELSDKDIIIK